MVTHTIRLLLPDKQSQKGSSRFVTFSKSAKSAKSASFSKLREKLAAKSASFSKLREKFAAKSANFSKLAKKLGEIRERKAQDGNNLRRNWFIGGCPISWRRPTLPHSHAVPSARTGLTALFGMGRGVPRGYNRHCLLKFLAYSTHINAL